MMSIIYSSPTIVIKQFILAQEKLFCDFFNDQEVMRYLPALDAEEFKLLFTKTFDDYKKGPIGRWGIFDSSRGDYIGNCLLRILAEDPGSYEIGYSIGKAYWGKGLGTEIAAALVEYAFNYTTSGDLTALTHPQNLGSQRVLEKAGFKREGNIERRGEDLFLFRLKRNVV